MMRALRNTADGHCLVFHVVLLAAYGVAFWIYLHPEPAGLHGGWSRAAFVAAATILLGWCAGIDVPVNFHNHAHRPFFRRPWMNRWLGRLWCFSSGWPSFFFEHAHITVHHANLLSERDWTLPHRGRDGRWESVARYALAHWPWRFARHLWRDFTAPDAPPGLAARACRELAIFLVLWSIPFWIDVRMALLLWVLPQWFGNLTISGAGMYAQHAGCTAKSQARPYAHSNSSLSPVLNYVLFNLGYHTHHHEHPTVHWTRLPQLHRRIADRLAEGGARVYRVGYHRMVSTLTKAWLDEREQERRLPRAPGFEL